MELNQKQIAITFVNKFYESLQDTDCVYRDSDCSKDYDMTWEGARQCAVIAVDLILETLPQGSVDYSVSNIISFMQDVKDEIESL